MKKGDLLVLIVLLLVAAAAYLIVEITTSGSNDLQAVVLADGSEVLRVDLFTEEFTRTIQSANGKIAVRIGSGSASVIEADCPDKLCIATGVLTKAGDVAVCLPSRIVLQIEGTDKIDSISH